MTSDTPIERAVAICGGNASELGRRIGATPARVCLARKGEAELTAEQRARLDALLTDPPAIITPKARSLDPSTTPDGRLIDRARALPGIGTLTALADKIRSCREHLTRVRRGQRRLSDGSRSALRQLLGEPVETPEDGFAQVSVRLAADEIDAFRDLADERGVGLREAVDAAVQKWLAEHHERLPVASWRAGLPKGSGWRVSIGTAVLGALDARLRAERGAASPKGRAAAVRQAILWAIEKSTDV